MKIIVFGATGGTGKEIVRQALEQGHTVTAFVRDAVSLTPPGGLPEGLRLFKGDIFDPAAVSEAIDGHQAVLSALGARSLKRERVLSRSIPNILAGMNARYVERIIVLGAAGAYYPAGKYQTGWFNLLMSATKATFLRQPFADQAAQERLLEQSGTDFTIVRPPRLNDKAEAQEVRVLPDGLPGGGWQISRADVADFMLLQLTDPRFHRQGVYISY
jgi:putative NADH-flavin reductase